MPKEKTKSQNSLISNAEEAISNPTNNLTDNVNPNGYFECSANSDCSSNEECKENKCVKTIKVDIIGHSRSKPAPINAPLTIHFGYSWGQLTDAEITLLNVKRGDSAWTAIKEANSFNSAPSEGKEYLLAKFRLKLLKTSDDNSYSLSSYSSFDAISAEGTVYEKPFVVMPTPELDGDLYAGATKEGWVAFEVDKTDANPLVSFNRDRNGQDELWFDLK